MTTTPVGGGWRNLSHPLRQIARMPDTSGRTSGDLFLAWRGTDEASDERHDGHPNRLALVVRSYP